MDGDDNGINAEHIYPQSKGAGEGDARSDMHSLVPARWAVNEARSNYPFADIPDVDTDRWYKLSENATTLPTSDIEDYSERLNGGFGTLGRFEPRESVKGDVARAVFYFYTMYRDEADREDPDYFELMRETLINWHHQDEVDSLEYVRNFRKADFQDGKLNPFILDCTLVNRAYGSGTQTDCDGSFTSSTSDMESGFKVYPNPVGDRLYLDCDSKEFEIRLYSFYGTLIKTFNKLPELDVSDLQSGLYDGVILKDGVRIKGFRFVKQ